MGLVLKTRTSGGVCIVDVSGRLSEEDSSALRSTVREILAEGCKHILLNLAEVSYVDSSGMGGLVSSLTTVANQGGELKLVNVTSRVLNVLMATKLYTTFPVFVEEEAALRSFSAPKGGAVQGAGRRSHS